MRVISRRLLYGVLVLLVWLSFVVEGSHAIFVDKATLKGGSISSGTASLLISNSQSPNSTSFDKERPGFNITLNPGEADSHYLILKNASNTDLEYMLDVQVVDSGVASSDFCDQVSVNFTPVDEQGNSIGVGKTFTYSQLMIGRQNLEMSVIGGKTLRLKMTTSLDGESSLQGSTASYDLVFTGTQRVTNI